MKNALCPVMSCQVTEVTAAGCDAVDEIVEVECCNVKCQLWATAYTTERTPYSNCCHVINALKNSEGYIPV